MCAGFVGVEQFEPFVELGDQTAAEKDFPVLLARRVSVEDILLEGKIVLFAHVLRDEVVNFPRKVFIALDVEMAMDHA